MFITLRNEILLLVHFIKIATLDFLLMNASNDILNCILTHLSKYLMRSGNMIVELVMILGFLILAL